MRPEDVISEPIVTEKSVMQQEENNEFSFAVNPEANKIEIRQAVEKQFDVQVDDVRTMNVRGKSRRVRWNEGMTADWKKAIVSLPEDEHIEIVEGLAG
ncbi:MAG: 50S ribosomal protein L23 [bacterium]